MDILLKMIDVFASCILIMATLGIMAYFSGKYDNYTFSDGAKVDTNLLTTMIVIFSICLGWILGRYT